ncbi:hypothetical protein M422DRAFT_78544, partial [Sphaerobolus stellatus SS14]
CGSPGAYECLDCDGIGYYCQGCMVAAHKHLPFHGIQEWDGNCMRRITLRNLGHIVYFAEQLLSCKWFPATVLRPQTAVTFRVLKLFHMLTM